MELPKHYSPANVEEKWYDHWMNKGYFHSVPDDREPFTIVIPPPNVTGVLHMGHILNNTIQDVLIRRARMQGKNACWVPGTDHASIATEAKVVGKLREAGIKKSDLTRDEFLDKAYEWKEEYGGIILHQLRRLGASCDWDRTRFTMEPKLYDAVIKVFVDLFNKGKIFRGLRMINWDPKALTALSNEEVIYKEENARLYYVNYKVEGSDDTLAIATTRPETIMGDTAICIHPDDKRFAHLHGKQAIVPMVDRKIPIILDDYVDMEFGTGCLKVTPAHDINDYELGKKHDLETIDIFNPNATLNENAEVFIGMDRFEARKAVIKELEGLGVLHKTEDLIHNVGYSERTDVLVEPRLSLQWFLEMDELAKTALDAVMKDEVKFFPDRFKNMYRHWLENIHEWCISRQLWWGQRIPAWYYGDGDDDFAVAETAEEALEVARDKSGNPELQSSDLRQDEDVLDTWASSWLWPISVFDGFESEEEIAYYYPTSVLVTGWDIIFFWVARMIMAGYEYRNERPFDAVYFTGMLRDNQGRKLSKSLGNSPDALELIDEYGADALRAAVLLSAPAGNDIIWNDDLMTQGRNFCNKIWNALRLVKSWEAGNEGQVESTAIEWMNSRVASTTSEVETSMQNFRIQDAIMSLYKCIWDDFCSWYLELIKPAPGTTINQETLKATLDIFGRLMKLLHPFLPFITEEIWHLLDDREEDIIVSRIGENTEVNEALIREGEWVSEFITRTREVRAKLQLKNQDRIKLASTGSKIPANWEPYILKLTGADGFDIVEGSPENATAFIAGKDEFYVLSDKEVDSEAEKQRMEEELQYYEGFLASVARKLSNERFVNNAPEAVVAKEKQKKADAEEKIRILTESLSKLN